MIRQAIVLALLLALGPAGCATRPGSEAKRAGDEIVVAGRMFHTGTPVVLWTDPGGYDAYRTEKRFVPWAKAPWSAPAKGADGPDSPARFGIRYAPRPERGETGFDPLTPEEFEQIRGGGWTLDLLREHVDQFVLHYDVCGVSRQCFRILHDFRGLSVHFMLDIDGTIYQTMDVKEKAWHATISNNRSVGIEIANMGAYGRIEKTPFAEWYDPYPPGWEWWDTINTPGYVAITPASPPLPPRITIPARLGDGGVREQGPFFPARAWPVVGPIHGRELMQMDYTPEQYAALIKLTAALHVALPKIRLECPRDAQGAPSSAALSREEWTEFAGVLGHYHIQTDKSDPGPALDWDRVLNGARRELGVRPTAVAKDTPKPDKDQSNTR